MNKDVYLLSKILTDLLKKRLMNKTRWIHVFPTMDHNRAIYWDAIKLTTCSYSEKNISGIFNKNDQF